MTDSIRRGGVDEQVQTLDVHIVDVLSHLEALLRHSHSIQRELLKMRSEAPPPSPAPSGNLLAVLNSHADEMRQDCEILAEIIEDLVAGIERLSAERR